MAAVAAEPPLPGALRRVEIELPLRVPVRGVTVRRATLVEGPAGWGEHSPFPGYPMEPGLAWRAAVEAATEPWPTTIRPVVAVAALIPGVEPARAAALAMRAVSAPSPVPGTVAPIRTVKVKVAEGDDVGRIAAVRDAVGPAVRIRVDANGAWDPETAIERLRRLAGYDLELAEQPVGALDELARLRRRVPVPLAADECIRGVGDARRLARLGAADVVVLKPQALGGVRAALRVAEAAGVPAIASSLVETSVGLAAGLALAGCLPETPYASGLGTATLLASDVVRDPLVPVGGCLTVRRPAPDAELLARYARAPG